MGWLLLSNVSHSDSLDFRGNGYLPLAVCVYPHQQSQNLTDCKIYLKHLLLFLLAYYTSLCQGVVYSSQLILLPLVVGPLGQYQSLHTFHSEKCFYSLLLGHNPGIHSKYFNCSSRRQLTITVSRRTMNDQCYINRNQISTFTSHQPNIFE